MENTNNIQIEVSNATACCIAALRALSSIRTNYHQALAEMCEDGADIDERYSKDEDAFINVERVLARALHTSIIGHVDAGSVMI